MNTTKTQLVKTVCGRCGGSGHHSYHQVHGTVCFKCNGSRYVMVNLKNEARRARARAERESQTDERRATMRRVYQEVVEEMNAIYKIGDVTTLLGIQLLDRAVSRDRGTTIARMRDERVQQCTSAGR